MMREYNVVRPIKRTESASVDCSLCDYCKREFTQGKNSIFALGDGGKMRMYHERCGKEMDSKEDYTHFSKAAVSAAFTFVI